MTRIDEQWAFLQDYCKLLVKAGELGFVVTAGELWRPPEMQKIYLDTGRSKTMRSQHLERLAGDLNFFRDGKQVTRKADLQVLGDYWESLSPVNRWGGNFKSLIDCPHFERNV